MSIYFKKPNGTIIVVQQQHDINSLKERFPMCDANGNEIKEEKPKKAKKASKKNKKEDK